MTRYVMRLPDLGEGTVSAEVISWKVELGDVVREDSPLVEMSTDKAVVEVPSPVSGRVVSITGKPGDVIAVGSEFIVFEIEAKAGASSAAPVAANAANSPWTSQVSLAKAAPAQAASAQIASATSSLGSIASAGRVMTSPATRRRAFETGIDLSTVSGSGPQGRILTPDLERTRSEGAGVTEIPVIGVRRLIAQRMAEVKRVAPHFAYVEEVDVTELEALRIALNTQRPKGSPSVTYLPFIVKALAQVLKDFPQCNALYDEKRNVILRHAAVHAGIATQTPDGLKVPVVRDVMSQDFEGLAAEIRRVSDAAKSSNVRRDELSGSTITVTSLGKLGGIVSTPILNLPEVAIIGINKAVERVVVVDGQMVIRCMMNISSSFDHRFVDGFDAAAMIQALKSKLESPTKIFN
ncbi:MAG: 2-oxo acid dehydrogenase subunit E2 [Gammaproteobacteria bacterium]|nr:2-oxo acid dehydrogenase subunit E2 [Gammaproteobacteria bacterium]